MVGMSNEAKPIILFEGMYAPANTRVRCTLVPSGSRDSDGRDYLSMVVVEVPIEGVRDVLGQISWQRCHQNWATDIKIDALATYLVKQLAQDTVGVAPGSSAT